MGRGPDPEKIDVALADRMADMFYLEGEGISAGANLLAGITYVWPQLNHQLPRAGRALAAWRRVDPGGAGEALCAELMATMADWLAT